MPKSSKLLTESICDRAIKSLSETGYIGIMAIKLKAIISAKEHGIKRVSEILRINKTSLTFWIKRFDQEGAFGLIPRPKKPRSSVISKEQQEVVSDWIKNDPGLTIDKIKLKIAKELNVRASRTTVHRIMGRIGFSHITGRPIHYKQDKKRLEEFKKNSTRNKRKKS